MPIVIDQGSPAITGLAAAAVGRNKYLRAQQQQWMPYIRQQQALRYQTLEDQQRMQQRWQMQQQEQQFMLNRDAQHQQNAFQRQQEVANAEARARGEPLPFPGQQQGQQQGDVQPQWVRHPDGRMVGTFPGPTARGDGSTTVGAQNYGGGWKIGKDGLPQFETHDDAARKLPPGTSYAIVTAGGYNDLMLYTTPPAQPGAASPTSPGPDGVNGGLGPMTPFQRQQRAAKEKRSYDERMAAEKREYEELAKMRENADKGLTQLPQQAQWELDQINASRAAMATSKEYSDAQKKEFYEKADADERALLRTAKPVSSKSIQERYEEGTHWTGGAEGKGTPITIGKDGQPAVMSGYKPPVPENQTPEAKAQQRDAAKLASEQRRNIAKLESEIRRQEASIAKARRGYEGAVDPKTGKAGYSPAQINIFMAREEGLLRELRAKRDAEVAAGAQQSPTGEAKILWEGEPGYKEAVGGGAPAPQQARPQPAQTHAPAGAPVEGQEYDHPQYGRVRFQNGQFVKVPQ